jgi:hypothetical protein
VADYEGLVDRLAAIEEELRDLAYGRLSDAARDPNGDEAAGARADEKRLLQARRGVARAIAALGGVPRDE